MPAPSVSVILPTWNRAALLREAVQSVFAQTQRDWELIIVDDGSTDDTRAYLKTLPHDRVRVILHEHCANPARLRNAAANVARGKYVAFLDSDDVWDARKLEVQVAALARDTDARWSYTRARWIDERGGEVPPPAAREWTPCTGWIARELLTWTAWVALPTVMVERELLHTSGGFDESLIFHEDFELWVRLAVLSPVTLVADTLTSIRLHAGNTWRAAPATSLEGFVALYDRLASEPRLKNHRATISRMRAHAVVLLADRYRGERRPWRGVRALLGAPRGSMTRSWWLALAKNAVRGVL
jgi:glycosyltransferase involved in cell wall biosynthesis